MACCKGEKIPYEELFPEELKTLRNNLVDYVGGNVGLGATPYGGNIAAPVNPASNAALNMVMGMMGHGGYSPFPGVPYTGGQQGAPMPWVPYPDKGNDGGDDAWKDDSDIIGKDELKDPSKTSKVKKDQLVNPNAWFDQYDTTTW